MPRRRECRGAQRRAQLTESDGDWLRRPDGRTKAGWRFLAFLLIAVVAVFLAGVAVTMLTATASAFGLRLILHPVVVPVGLLAAHAVVVKRFEAGSWRYVGLDGEAAAPRRLGKATLFGGGAIAVPTVALLAVGYLALVPAPDGSLLAAAANAIWILVPAALAEELLARGYVFSLLRESFGWRWALIATSVGFGLLHLANPGSNPQAIVNVVLAGLFLGLVLIRFASLYAAWVAHAAWNLVLAAAFHADVSGMTIGETPRFRLVDTGPDWLTGGVWGPEGGAAAALGLAVACALLARPLLATPQAATGPDDVRTTDESVGNG